MINFTARVAFHFQNFTMSDIVESVGNFDSARNSRYLGERTCQKYTVLMLSSNIYMEACCLWIYDTVTVSNSSLWEFIFHSSSAGDKLVVYSILLGLYN